MCSTLGFYFRCVWLRFCPLVLGWRGWFALEASIFSYQDFTSHLAILFHLLWEAPYLGTRYIITGHRCKVRFSLRIIEHSHQVTVPIFLPLVDEFFGYY